MINENRIVPITATDLLSMIGVVFGIVGTSIAKVDASNDLGDFAIESGSGNLLASEPVRSFDFGADVSAVNVYFIPTYDYVGFSIAGTAVEASGDVNPDGKTLYKAVLADSAVTITKVGF